MPQRADQVEYAKRFVGALGSGAHITLQGESCFRVARLKRITIFGWPIVWLANKYQIWEVSYF